MATKSKAMVDGLMQGLREAALHSQGKRKLKERFREIVKPAPRWTPSKIRNLRKEIYQMSQPSFAALLNVTTSSVRAWEQGQKSPSGAAARLLQLLEIDIKSAEKLAA